MQPLGPHSIRLVPLGGLGEIGMNCLAMEQGEDILVIDCGVTFPQQDLGIDVLHPDFSWLLERKERVRGVFLTHGHEDHVGALPYLLDLMTPPIYGSPHALGLARHRLEQHEMRSKGLSLRTAAPGSTYVFGSFAVEPFRVAHSIVEATGLRIETCAGVVVHTGDFTFDPTPPDGEPSDEARLEAMGDAGVALLLSDSTNVDVAAKAGSEREVGETLERLVTAATGRVFVALFASNIQRLIMLGEIARRTGRRLCLLGRSLNVQVEIATEVGRLSWPSDLRLAPEQARTYPRDELLVLAGGTQAEASSAMARLAAAAHPDLAVEAGDTVVLSSRIIPGNERPVFTMMSDLLRLGACLHTRLTEPRVHTSGHATREEQLHMLDLLRPRCFLPIHGTLHHLVRHAQLAHEAGVAEVLVAENGSSVVFDGSRLELEGRVPSGAIAVTPGAVPLEAETLKERAELARGGLVVVLAVLDPSGRILVGPTVSARGVPGMNGDPRSAGSLAAEATRVIEQASGRRQRQSTSDLQEEVRRAIRRLAERRTGNRPVVEVHLASARSA